MGKPTICIGENKDADQLRGNREADQRLCKFTFRIYFHSFLSRSFIWLVFPGLQRGQHKYCLKSPNSSIRLHCCYFGSLRQKDDG